MIVDDEDPVLDSYSYMVRSRSDQFEVCALARTGFEAISLAHSKVPDLVFMDIGMPGIDGLDTIKELQRSYPSMLFVLSTAYERFDVAKKAIPLGVFDYLVKPISRKKFLETLEKAGHHLDEKRDIEASRLEGAKLSADSRAWEEKNFLLMATWKSLSEYEWEEYKRLFSIQADQAAFFLVGLSGMDADGISHLRKEICRAIACRYQLLSTEYLGKLLLFIPGEEDGGKLRLFLEGVIRRTVPENCSVRTGLGSFHPRDTFFRSCGEALRSFVEEEETEGGSEEREALKKLRRAISRGNSFETIHSICAGYSEHLFSTTPFTIAKARMVALFSLLLDDLYRTLGADDFSHQLFDPAVEITALTSRQEWDAWSGRALRILVETENRLQEKRLPAVLGKAIYYIQGNYDKPLQLSDLAAFCTVSQGYLSRLFTEHLHLPFIDYLTSVRMKAAEELLLENVLSVKEIAHAVGYQDPNYFSRIFRRTRGIAPTSYFQERIDDDKD
jgi:two-component system, response regulator YesN